jgi:glycosyl hydrolase family 25
MMDKPFGVDLSHHQSPKAMPWGLISQSSSFAIVRASYGVMPDRVTKEHMARARDAGLAIGTYHFFRPSQAWSDQLSVFRAVVDGAGYGIGDILPALDIESDPVPKPGTPVSTAWQAGVSAMLDAFSDIFGGAIVYITAREFAMLGSPEWLLDFPQWTAHYTTASKPATPGKRPWLIWQHRVGAYDPAGPGGYYQAPLQLDQNRISAPLPRISWPVTETPPPDPNGHEDDDRDLEQLLAGQRAAHVDDTMAQVRKDRDRDISEDS